MNPSAAESMLAELRRLKLLTDEAAARVGVARLDPGSPDAVRVLVEAGLTRFQARAALAGKAGRLQFGPYVLLDKIGEGGVGVVYRARHARLGRIDAVKVLRTDKVGLRGAGRRFLREIQLTSSLEHPHIVRALDAGEVGGQLYLATEYVRGTDLATLVRSRGPLSAADACLALYHAGLALHHVHEKGLVHRDLKPSNLILDNATGAVKLLDLGLSGFNRGAIEVAPGNTLTRAGSFLGTPDFMAPEQVQNPHAVDIRADLYSLGCTLYFLLTARPPFDGTAVEKMYHHGFAAPPPLALASGLPPPSGLAGIFSRLVAKRPEERYQTSQEFCEALLAIRPGANPVVPTTPSVAVPTPPPVAGLPPGEFDDLIDDTDSFAEPPSRFSHSGGSRWVAAAVILVLFVLGFVAAAVWSVAGR